MGNVPNSLYIVFLVLQIPFKVHSAQFGHKNGERKYIPKVLNNCVIRHKPYIRFHVLVLKKICTNQDIFKYTINCEGKSFPCLWDRKRIHHRF